MNHSATYSPEDNKLRLYPSCRLPVEEYQRVKAAGFIWAPKQELFVAPMWTPNREDLLVEMCGEIGDEDKSLVERAEERAERFEDYADNRQADADAAHKAVESICEHIPLGQPILVGHHSERHARKDAERIENGMRKAVKMWEQSKYWSDRAKGAIHAAKYKERPDVRARRIKKIEADKRRQERSKEESNHCLKLWESCSDMERARHISGCTEAGWLPTAKHPSLDQYLHPSDVLDFPDRSDYAKANYPTWTLEQVKERARECYGRAMANCDRWISHYENRLTYERTMLAEDGGTVSDRKGPEVGGGCRCWASPGRFGGGWSYIQKVNKVSVTVLDNWGNGGGNFTRTIPFDKLHAIMTAAEVQAAREAGTLKETADKIGFFLLGEAPKTTAASKPPTEEPKADQFQAMKETLNAGVQVVTPPNLFPTPAPIVRQMIDAANMAESKTPEQYQTVLEPSAGTGAIVKELRERFCRCDVVAVEINPALAEQLRERFGTADIHCADFLQCNGDLGKFDRILMNPPFDHGSDIKHIKHAMGFLNLGGRLVALCANGPRQREELKPLASEWIDLPAGTFAEQGTGVNVAMLVIDAQ